MLLLGKQVHFAALRCAVVHCTMLCFAALHCTALHYTVLRYTALRCGLLFCGSERIALCSAELRCRFRQLVTVSLKSV